MASSILSEDKSVSFARAFSMELIMDTVVITEKVVAMEKVLTTERVAIMEEELTTGKVATMTMTSAIPGHLAHHWGVRGSVLDLFG